MSSDKLLEAAKGGDLLAISNLVQQAFTPQEVCIDAEMQLGITLWLKLKSDKSLDSQNCLNVILKTLDSIQLKRIVSVRISETSPEDPKKQVWNNYWAFKQEKFVDNTVATEQMTKVVIQMAAAFVGLVTLMLVFAPFIPTSTTSVTSKPTSTASTSSPSTGSRIFLGKSQTGYELWADKSCVYVKGITEADLARLNTNVWNFKDEVKVQTGYRCVLFE